MDEEENKEFGKFIKRIREKLAKNSNLSEEVEKNINRLSEIFETEVNINLEYYPNVENYNEMFKTYENVLNKDNIDIISLDDMEETMDLGELKELLDTEENDLKLTIDPIYLKEGINNINNMLITTVKDNLILIPTIKK